MNTLLAALLFTVLTCAPASAGGAPELPSIFAKLKPKVGSWAEYGFETKKGGKLKAKGVFKMAVVGKEGDLIWVEQKMTSELPKPDKGEGTMTMKFLTGKDGVAKAYMKSEQGVMDMTKMMGAASRKKQAAVEKTEMKEAGTEKVEVPAGTFKATRYTYEEGKDSGDTWIKAGVGPYGLIKQVSREGKETSTLQLLASGNDAKSEVDEKSAQSPFGAMMGKGGRPAKADRGDDEQAGEDAPEEPTSDKPSFGGMFKKALKNKAGLGD